jgi:hypothetical protein
MSDAAEQWCKSSQAGIDVSTITGLVTCNDCGKVLGDFFALSTQGHLRAVPEPIIPEWIPPEDSISVKFSYEGRDYEGKIYPVKREVKS